MSAREVEVPEGVGLPEEVGVVGGGRMGAGIAHAFLTRGARVVLLESDAERAAAAGERVASALRASEERGALPGGAAEAMARLRLDTSTSALAAAGLVIEAVPEDAALKARVLADVDAVAAEGAVLATNTSSIGIDELSAAVSPGRTLLGLHFFNPVPASALVEVVLGATATPELAERARGWVHQLGKTAVVVRDSPGFASSRLGVALGLEAVRTLAEGVASAEDIDAAMVLGYRHPVGPLRLTDLVGLDVRLGIAEHLHATLGDRFAPPDLLRELVARGHLGRKSGQGFYAW